MICTYDKAIFCTNSSQHEALEWNLSQRSAEYNILSQLFCSLRFTKPLVPTRPQQCISADLHNRFFTIHCYLYIIFPNHFHTSLQSKITNMFWIIYIFSKWVYFKCLFDRKLTSLPVMEIVTAPKVRYYNILYYSLPEHFKFYITTPIHIIISLNN